MPRPKTIDMEEIRLEKIDLATIEAKCCLQAKLVFQESFNDRQWHTFQSYYRFEVDKENKTITVNTNNSWKGLIMVFLSITYVKFGSKITGRLIDVQQYSTLTMASTDYQLLQNESIFVDKRVEQVAAPPSWMACYVRGNYEPAHIDESIHNFVKLLKVDAKQSYLRTEFASTHPHQYKYKPLTEPIDNTGLLCCYLESEKGVPCVEGSAVISDEELDKMFGNRQAQKFPVEISPEILWFFMKIYDDPMKPIPLYAYQIRPEHIAKLSSYFPYLSKAFQSIKNNEPPYDWVVFDRKHLGKWG